MKYIPVLFWFFIFSLGFSQKSPQETIKSLMQAMYESDAEKADALFYSDVPMRLIYLDSIGQTDIIQDSSKGFVGRIAAAGKKSYDERIISMEVKTDDYLAQAWVPYIFYHKGALSHCGTNLINLIKTNEGWKILNIDYTLNKNCEELPQKNLKQELNSLLDNWHKAAATANESEFFGAMQPKGVYIGTDATELWTIEEMEKKYGYIFEERDVAWAFTPTERNWYFSDNKNVAWFDELLDTWMGVCRSSGVLEKNGDRWQLKHYHLSVAVPNEVVDDYLKLIGIERKK